VNQRQSILERRRDAYQDDVLEDGIIPLSAAFAAQDHGDARKAIDLFRKAGEIADRGGEDTVREEHIRDAQKEAERDRTLTQMQGLSTQTKLSLYATAIVPVYSQRNLNAVPSTVAYGFFKPRLYSSASPTSSIRASGMAPILSVIRCSIETVRI
jgi:cell division control protein 6